MIKMTRNPISEMYSRICIESFNHFKHKVKTYEAVTPKDLYLKDELKFGKKDSRKEIRDFTPTEKAVWYSHYELWKKCIKLNKPIIVVEHDSKLIRQLPQKIDVKKGKFLSFIYRDWNNDNVKHLAPGSGYYITPLGAKILCKKALNNVIKENSDGHLINNLYRPKPNEDYYYIKQISIDGLNTIDHKAKFKNFVGQDYEKIDIPSLHGQEI